MWCSRQLRWRLTLRSRPSKPTGVRGSPTVAAHEIGPGAFNLRLADAGRWKLQAKADGRWRAVAWRGPGDPPDPVDGLTVELTAKGYLRLHRAV